MKVIFICSPFRAADSEKLQGNIEYAKELTRRVLLRGECAIAPHLYITQCLDDTKENERNLGIVAGQDLLRRCDGILVGYRYGISEGMRKEIQCAKDGAMCIEYIR